MIAMSVPVAMPIPRTLREHMFLPVTTKTTVSITEIISIAELASRISLVPHACGGWISVIRESRKTISLTRLSDGRCNVWT
jgi:hypothetical protein